MIDAKVLLRSGFFSDTLSAAETFSLTTQKSDIDIIAIVENIESTKQGYEKLLKKFKGNPKATVTNLPTLSAIITEIEGNEDEEPIYQDQKLKYYTQVKLYLKNHDAELIESIFSCYVKRYSDVYSEKNDKGSISDGDNILFHVCCVLNSAVWPDLTKDSDEDEIKLSLQLNKICEIYEKYKSMPIFELTSLESLQNGYTEFVCYAHHYFDIDNVKPEDLWPKLCRLGKEREDGNQSCC